MAPVSSSANERTGRRFAVRVERYLTDRPVRRGGHRESVEYIEDQVPSVTEMRRMIVGGRHGPGRFRVQYHDVDSGRVLETFVVPSSEWASRASNDGPGGQHGDATANLRGQQADRVEWNVYAVLQEVAALRLVVEAQSGAITRANEESEALKARCRLLERDMEVARSVARQNAESARESARVEHETRQDERGRLEEEIGRLHELAANQHRQIAELNGAVRTRDWLILAAALAAVGGWYKWAKDTGRLVALEAAIERAPNAVFAWMTSATAPATGSPSG